MSYQIQYNPNFWRHCPRKKREGNNASRSIGLAVCAIAVCASLFYGDRIREFMIPGDPAVTTVALNHMQDNLKNGERVSSVLKEFCQEIFEHGKSD